jgi:hypothetical protein
MNQWRHLLDLRLDGIEQRNVCYIAFASRFSTSETFEV